MANILLNQLLEKDKASALLANFAQMFPSSVQICLVDVQGQLVGYHPFASRDVDTQRLLPIIERVCKSRRITPLPTGIATPVWVRGEPSGALIVATPDELDPNKIAALQFLSRVISLLAENSLTQEDLLGETLDRYRELNLLYRAGESIAASLDLATVNRLILNESTQLVQATEGALMLVDRETGQLTVWASYGLDAVKDIGAGIPPGHDLAEQVMRRGETQVSERPVTAHQQRPPGAALCVPLKIKDEVLGVLSLAHTDPDRTFRPSDISLINALAGQAAVAIDNARMFSDLSALHAEIEEANRRLLELDKLKSSFIGVITHELRSPFANIDFSVQLIERYGTQNWLDDQREQWEQMIRGIREAKGMIDNLVSFAGLLSRQSDLDLTQVDFAQLVNDVIATLAQVIRSRQLELYVDKAEDMPLVRADPKRLEEIVHHLLYNAIKFNRPGGSIRVRYSSDDKGVRFEVQDTGVGIPAGKLELIWDTFAQLADPLKRGKEGLGLGLALIQYLVHAHGGRVGATSQEGVGSTFGFWLPIAGPGRPQTGPLASQ